MSKATPGNGDHRTPKAVVVAGSILAVAALASMLPERGDRPDSPSSSYSTGATGSGAYAELLRRFDHPVRRLRVDLDRADLEPQDTLVVLDAPALTEREARSVGRFLRAGGRLVAGGRGVEAWLEDAVGGPIPAVEETPVRLARPEGNAPEIAAIDEVHLAGRGSFGRAGSFQPLLVGREGGVVAIAGDVGRGRVVVLADPTMVHNRLLGSADNAGFGLAVAGPAGRPVAFAEAPHGYGPARGLAALPARWRAALAGLGVAAAVWLAARARRLGPPEEEVRALPPPRRVYVDAMAATLGRTGQPVEAAQPVRGRARALVLERAGLAAGTGDEALRHAALRLGLPPAEAEALVAMGDESAVMAAGRALVHLEGGPQ